LKTIKCKFQIPGAGKTDAQTLNFLVSTFKLRCLLVLSGLLPLGAFGGLASSHAGEPRPFSIEKAKDRTGRGSFPHDLKEHVKVQCADCHSATKDKIENTDQPMAKEFPHAVCVRCHNFAAEFFKAAFGQTSRFCGVCHETRRISKSDKSLRPGVFPHPNTSDFVDEFSHKAHRKILPADFRIVAINNSHYGSQFEPGESPRCTDCHEPNKKAKPGAKDIKTEASHATCFVCHGGAPPKARKMSAEIFPYDRDCKVCHTLRGPGIAPLAQRLFGSIKDFRHSDHEKDIRPKKRGDFPFPTAPDHLCAECHTPADRVEKLSDIKLPESGYCDRCHINNRPGLPGKLSDDTLKKLKGS
jgi:hypothetical protein